MSRLKSQLNHFFQVHGSRTPTCYLKVAEKSCMSKQYGGQLQKIKSLSGSAERSCQQKHVHSFYPNKLTSSHSTGLGWHVESLRSPFFKPQLDGTIEIKGCSAELEDETRGFSGRSRVHTEATMTNLCPAPQALQDVRLSPKHTHLQTNTDAPNSTFTWNSWLTPFHLCSGYLRSLGPSGQL